VRYELGFAHRLLGEISLKNDLAQAVLHFEKSIAIFREIKAENELAMAYSGYGRLLKEQGEIAQAREFLIDALEIFERLGTLIQPEKIRGNLAELPAA
jgi:tetratricopeptide (TPR) repeat protein